jgi:putative membrane protein insertion efficiency factor
MAEVMTKPSYYTKNIFFLLLFAYCCSACAHSGPVCHSREGGNPEAPNPFIYPVEFYRKYISKAMGGRCPMYPSCSQYCIDALKKHGPVVGWIMTCDRLMRCGRDEVRLSPPVWINGKTRCYDPVSNNDFWWK